MAVTVTQVLPGSPAHKKKIRAGDRLLSVNGHDILDVLDYRFYLMETKLELRLDTPKGERRVTVKKPEYADIGLEFETYLMDKQHTCRNRCVFCFVDQLPPGMRESLYFKDDDSRLSFLFGNYITLTNLSEHEVQRIIDMHISPINISVHTTNPELRCRMMNNRFAGDTLSLLTRFAEAGIHMECQLVVCPDWNDKEELARTMHDLAVLAPAVESVAVVPVGLTKHRDGLTPLRAFTQSEAAAVIDAVETFGAQMLAATGNRLVYASDEFYIEACRPIPDEDFYGEMSQLENGVGLIALLRREFYEALDTCDAHTAAGTPTVVATGVAAAPFLQELAAALCDKVDNVQVTVCPIRNTFFGESITVAGLVTGGDIAAQLKGTDAKRVLIPDVMLRHEGDRFLDDMTPEQLAEQLQVTVQVVPVNGAALLDALLQ